MHASSGSFPWRLLPNVGESGHLAGVTHLDATSLQGSLNKNASSAFLGVCLSSLGSLPPFVRLRNFVRLPHFANGYSI